MAKEWDEKSGWIQVRSTTKGTGRAPTGLFAQFPRKGDDADYWRRRFFAHKNRVEREAQWIEARAFVLGVLVCGIVLYVATTARF